MPIVIVSAEMPLPPASAEAGKHADVEIRDPTVSDRPYSSAQAIADPTFREFVVGSLAALPSKRSLRFFRSPLVTSGDRLFPPAPEAFAAVGAGCRVRTPWFSFAVANGAVAGVFLWNERQVLRDRASLTGGGPESPSGKSPAPFPRSTFERLARAYADGDAQALRAAPPELIWLFERTPRNRRGRFSDAVAARMREVGAQAAGSYVRLAKSLVERCARDGEDIVIADAREASATLGE